MELKRDIKVDKVTRPKAKIVEELSIVPGDILSISLPLHCTSYARIVKVENRSSQLEKEMSLANFIKYVIGEGMFAPPAPIEFTEL